MIYFVCKTFCSSDDEPRSETVNFGIMCMCLHLGLIRELIDMQQVAIDVQDSHMDSVSAVGSIDGGVVRAD